MNAGLLVDAMINAYLLDKIKSGISPILKLKIHNLKPYGRGQDSYLKGVLFRDLIDTCTGYDLCDVCLGFIEASMASHGAD